jgi:hypothetical protein
VILYKTDIVRSKKKFPFVGNFVTNFSRGNKSTLLHPCLHRPANVDLQFYTAAWPLHTYSPKPSCLIPLQPH